MNSGPSRIQTDTLSVDFLKGLSGHKTIEQCKSQANKNDDCIVFVKNLLETITDQENELPQEHEDKENLRSFLAQVLSELESKPPRTRPRLWRFLCSLLKLFGINYCQDPVINSRRDLQQSTQDLGINSSGDNLTQLFNQWIVPALESNEIEKQLEEDIEAIKALYSDKNPEKYCLKASLTHCKILLRLRIAVLCLRRQVLHLNRDDKEFLGTTSLQTQKTWQKLKDHLKEKYRLKLYSSKFVEEDRDEEDRDEDGQLPFFAFLVNNQINNEDEYLESVVSFFRDRGITLKPLNTKPQEVS